MTDFTFTSKITKFFFFCLLFFVSFLIRAQSVDLVRWPLTSNGNPVVVTPGVSAATLTRSGVTNFGFSATGVIGSSWRTANNVLLTTNYYQISITPPPGKNLFIDRLILTHVRGDVGSSRGPQKYQIRSSLNPFDNFATSVSHIDNITIPGAGKSDNISINRNVADGETLTIRFYGYFANSTASGRTWRIVANTLKITGTVNECLSTTTWTPSGWNSGGTPDLSKKVIINADYTTQTNGEFNACELIVNGGKTLTVSPGKPVRVLKKVDTAPSGYLIVQDSGSLMQINDDAINTGVITVKRNTTPITKFDFTYWSSPVSGQSLFDVSPTTLRDKYFSYDTAVQNWKTEMDGATVMTPGNGYIIRSPQSFSTSTPSLYNAIFTGAPNNGVITVNIPLASGSTGNFALVGNPYPSAVDADAFITQNASILKGALYFWTHNAPVANNIYNANDYAVYTLMGGVGTSGSPTPNGTIASGQGFFVDLNDGLGAGTNLVFNNSMRITAVGQNSVFFAANQSRSGVAVGGLTTNTTETATASKSRLWLNLTNDQGAFSQTLVGYADAATNGFDRLFDGIFLDGFENVISFYSLLQDQWLSIQAKATPVENDDIIPLGYKSSITGTFSISIADLDGLFADQDVVLEDKLTGMTKLLKESNYTFTTEKGTFNDRFVIKFANKTLSSEDFVTDNSLSVQVFSTAGQLTFKATNESISGISIYDITGRLLFNKTNVLESELVVPIQQSNKILVAKIELGNGQRITKKNSVLNCLMTYRQIFF